MKDNHAFAPKMLILMGLAAALAVAVPALAVPPGNGKLQVIHLDANQGDAAVIISPLGEVYMVDEGTNFTDGSSPPSCAKVLSQLQSLGISHIEKHFASHYHSDHIGCITSLTGITIDQGWDRSGSYTSTAYTNYNSYLGGVPGPASHRHTLTKGQVFTMDSLSAHPVTVTVIALAGDGVSNASTDENALSVSLKVSYGEYDEELGGDLTGGGSTPDVETKVGPQVGKVEVYKAHHHASATSNNNNWLNAVQPKVCIISCGTGNNYGHPTATTLTNLHNHGVRSFWTQTGTGVAPNPALGDKVANGMIRIVATWEPGGVDSIYTPSSVDTLTNSGTALDHIAPVAAMTSPNGGESWVAGSTQTVGWTASDNVGVDSVNLDYSVHGPGGPWEVLQHGLANTGSYDWTLPDEISDSVIVQVTAYDHMLNTGLDQSDNLFQIASPTVSVPTSGVARFGISQPRPNPTRGGVSLRFSLAEAGSPRLDVLDVGGRRVWEMAPRSLGSGEHEIAWDGRDARGNQAGSGLYFVRLTANGRQAVTRFVVLR